MRIWDISPKKLCRSHLLGEHRELHAIWSILTKKKKGYSRHPETLRWKNKLKSLWLRHESLAEEMKRRGYNHRSVIDCRLAVGSCRQNKFIDSYRRQVAILKKKRCQCKV